MRRYYPAFLDVAGKRVLIVGGGPVAARKARTLSRYGARTTIVAPRMTQAARRSAQVARQRPFSGRDLRAMTLVICATDDRRIDARVSALCRRRGIWANVADRPALCDFIAPAVARRGKITVAVSTGGASPALAKSLRQRLARAVTAEDVRAADRLARLRPALLSMSLNRRRKFLTALLSEKPR